MQRILADFKGGCSHFVRENPLHPRPSAFLSSSAPAPNWNETIRDWQGEAECRGTVCDVSANFKKYGIIKACQKCATFPNESPASPIKARKMTCAASRLESVLRWFGHSPSVLGP